MQSNEIDRTRRVAELIRRELSALLAREVDDHRVRMVSITAVTISRDLKHAKVYVTALEQAPAATSPATPPATRHDAMVGALNHASKYLRRLLSQRLDLRATPRLRFQYDHNLRRALDLGDLIDTLNRPTDNPSDNPSVNPSDKPNSHAAD